MATTTTSSASDDPQWATDGGGRRAVEIEAVGTSRRKYRGGMSTGSVICAGCIGLALGAIIGVPSSKYFGFFTTFEEAAPPSAPTTCDSPACVKAAANLLMAMDTTASPCEDFFQHACGNWPTIHPMPASKSSFSTFSVLAEANNAVLRAALEQPVQGASDPVAKAKRFYAQCMDTEAIDALGAAPAASLLLSASAWATSTAAALSSEWNGETWVAFAQALAHLNWHGIHPLLNAHTYADQHDPQRNVMHLYAAGLGLSRGYYVGKNQTSDTYLLAYHSYAATLFELAGVYDTPEAARAAAGAVVAFEADLAALTLPPAETRLPENFYVPTTPAALAATLSPFPWYAYADAYYSSVRGDNASAHLPSPMIIASGARYFESLFGLVGATPTSTLVDYLRLQVLTTAAPHLSSAFVDARFAFRRTIYGITAQSERWKTCVSYTDGALGFVLGRAFTDVAFSEASRDAAVEMIGGIKRAFEENLPSVPWMDDTTRDAARTKADLVYDMIGYPDWIRNDTALGERYAGLEVAEGGTHFDAMASSWRLNELRNIEDLDRPVDKRRWGMSPPTVNAYYSPTKNEIVFPAGILQPPFWFGAEALSAINYGGIGSVIGHELTHGFDDSGANYDGHGNLTTWWPSHVKAAFHEKTACISKEYAGFALPTGEHVNGNLTTGENIADNGGIKMAHAAWRKASAAAGGDGALRLPGLPETTPEQIFFLSYAQNWCGVVRPEAAHRWLLSDPHSPRRFRVNGVMQNSLEFSQAFGCAAGAALNPTEKCVVW